MLINSNKNMSLKHYRVVKIIFSFILALTFSQAIIYKNFLIPVILLVVGSLILLVLRRRVTEVIADERDYATAGKAALWAIQVYSWLAVVAMLLFYAERDLNPAYEPMAMVLAYSACLLILVYAIIFRYLNRVSFSSKKLIYIVAAIVLLMAVAAVSLRLFSGEDNWICVQGVWQQHGHPSFSAPSTICK
jgi:uncharacterized membrane protein